MSLSPAAVEASSLFWMVETDFFGLILFFCLGCVKGGGGVGVRRLAGLSPDFGFLDSLDTSAGATAGSSGEGWRAASGLPGVEGLAGFDHEWYFGLRTLHSSQFQLCAKWG
jgi:hypothetical protein